MPLAALAHHQRRLWAVAGGLGWGVSDNGCTGTVATRRRGALRSGCVSAACLISEALWKRTFLKSPPYWPLASWRKADRGRQAIRRRALCRGSGGVNAGPDEAHASTQQNTRATIRTKEISRPVLSDKASRVLKSKGPRWFERGPSCFGTMSKKRCLDRSPFPKIPLRVLA